MKYLSAIILLLSLSSYHKIETIYVIDKGYSQVSWAGTTPFEVYKVIVKMKSGTMKLVNNEPVNAEYVIDMKTITLENIKDSAINKGIVDHLKSKDFFEVDKYPTASIKAIKIEKKGKGIYWVEASLTIKDSTKAVSFPMRTYGSNDKLVAEAFLDIKRIEWGITYNSKAVMSSLEDGFIYDKIGFSVTAAMWKQYN